MILYHNKTLLRSIFSKIRFSTNKQKPIAEILNSAYQKTLKNL
jgi:hypothetical protein